MDSQHCIFLFCFFPFQIENLEHCDFIPLRNMLVRTHLQDLKDVTNNVHYENYRCRKLAGVAGGSVDKIPNRVRSKDYIELKDCIGRLLLNVNVVLLFWLSTLPLLGWVDDRLPNLHVKSCEIFVNKWVASLTK